MERFKVDGTSLVSWTIQVQATNEMEARNQAACIAGWIDFPSILVTRQQIEHSVTMVRSADPKNE